MRSINVNDTKVNQNPTKSIDFIVYGILTSICGFCCAKELRIFKTSPFPGLGFKKALFFVK